MSGQRDSATYSKLFQRMALSWTKLDSGGIVHYSEGANVKPLLST